MRVSFYTRAACRAAPPAAPRRLTQLTAHWHRPSNPSARTAGATELGAHAGFPVIPRAEAPASYTYMSVRDPEAKNLDGSVYGIAVCLSTVSKANWTFSTDGGGWCYDEASCFQRASTTLGSNKTWPGEAAAMGCNAGGTMNYARFFYGDGASRSGDVAAPVAVPGNPAQTMWFRGKKSFDAGLDLLIELGMSQAELIVFTGGSAGGLTVFLHLDHVAARMKTEAPRARVVGERAFTAHHAAPARRAPQQRP